jgi:hypothetical protein
LFAEPLDFFFAGLFMIAPWVVLEVL